MINDEIKKGIIDFNNIDYKNKAFFAGEIFKKYPDINLILNSLKDLINENDYERFTGGLSFFVYVMNNFEKIPGKSDKIFVDYAEEDYHIFTVLKKKLVSDNFFIRSEALDALVQLGYEDCYEFIIEDFDFFLKYDPISLPSVIAGLLKMTGEIPWDQIYKIFKNQNFIVRWSFLNVLNLTNLDFEKTYEILDKLANDDNEQIAQEAEYFYNKLKKEETEAGSNSDKNGKNNPEPALPDITFNIFTADFLTYMVRDKKINYTIDEIVEFYDYYIEEKEDLIDKFIKLKNQKKQLADG